MTTPRVYKTEAIILKHTRLGESDRVVTLYTPKLGKVKAIAKGARRPGSKLGGHVELMTHSSVLLSHGRTFDILTQGQAVNCYLPLRDDLWLSSCGMYAIDAVDSFTEERLENEPVFDLLKDTLGRLCEAVDRDLVLRYFEVQLLDLLGYRPQLYKCVTCGAALQQLVNYFSSRQGGVLCPVCSLSEPSIRAVSVNALKVLRLWQSNDFATARRLRIDQLLAFELEQLLRHYIGYLLDFEMTSATWLSKLKSDVRRASKRPESNGRETQPKSTVAPAGDGRADQTA
jgi:DNA repair protein RecO (recombination protein O)